MKNGTFFMTLSLATINSLIDKKENFKQIKWGQNFIKMKDIIQPIR